MVPTYNQIGNELRDRKWKLNVSEKSCRAVVGKIVEAFNQQLDYPNDAIAYYRKNSDKVFVLVTDLEQISLSSDGSFYVGLKIEFRSPGQDGARDKVLLELKLTQVGEAIEASLEGTTIRTRMTSVNDGKSFGDFLRRLATFLGELYSKEFDAFLTGQRPEGHPAHETATRLIDTHAQEQKTPRAKIAA